MEDIFSMIGSVGFPICMCVYLVHFMETEQKSMKDTISGLREAILTLTERLTKGEKDEN